MNSTEQIFKSEIHVHLEATITPDLCRKLAKRNNVNLSEDLFGIGLNNQKFYQTLFLMKIVLRMRMLQDS